MTRTRTPRHRWLAASAAAVLTLGVAACSDDDGDEDDIDNPVDGVDDQLDDVEDDVEDELDDTTVTTAAGG